MIITKEGLGLKIIEFRQDHGGPFIIFNTINQDFIYVPNKVKDLKDFIYQKEIDSLLLIRGDFNVAPNPCIDCWRKTSAKRIV